MMRTLTWLAVALSTLSLILGSVQSATPKVEASKGLLRHVVAFKFKEGTTADQIQKVETAFAALKTHIPQIQQFEWGLNNSPEKLNKGCTHGFILTFKNEQDRDAYLVHPEHKKFGELVGPLLADVFVIDFFAR